MCPSYYQIRHLKTHLCTFWVVDTHTLTVCKCKRALPTSGVTIPSCNLWVDAPISNNLETSVFPPTNPHPGGFVGVKNGTFAHSFLGATEDLSQISISMLGPQSVALKSPNSYHTLGLLWTVR